MRDDKWTLSDEHSRELRSDRSCGWHTWHSWGFPSHVGHVRAADYSRPRGQSHYASTCAYYDRPILTSLVVRRWPIKSARRTSECPSRFASINNRKNMRCTLGIETFLGTSHFRDATVGRRTFHYFVHFFVNYRYTPRYSASWQR